MRRFAARRLAARVGYPRRTVFGDVWELVSGATSHLDSAYELTELDVHTDGTFSHDGPGTLLLTQQARTGGGGVSLLLDAGGMLVQVSFDNWRCLHGRTAFTGHRSFVGCYTNHEDLEGAWRRAGLR